MRLIASANSLTSSPKSVANNVLTDDVEREVHHVDGDVTLLPVAPTVSDIDPFMDDRIRIFRNSLPMKCGLCHLPLGAMLGPFSRNHAFSQQHLRTTDRALLYKIIVLHNQDFANVIGVVQKQNMVPTDLVMRDVAVFLRQVLKENNGISRAKAAECEPKQVSLKTSRKSVRPLIAIPTHLVLSCGCHYNQFKRSIGFSGTRRTQGRRAFLLATNLIALVKPEMTLANGGL